MDVEDRLTAATALLLVSTLAALATRSRVATTLAALLLVATTLATRSRAAVPSPPLLTTAS
jgi:hypothetical protein